MRTCTHFEKLQDPPAEGDLPGPRPGPGLHRIGTDLGQDVRGRRRGPGRRVAFAGDVLTPAGSFHRAVVSPTSTGGNMRGNALKSAAISALAALSLGLVTAAQAANATDTEGPRLISVGHTWATTSAQFGDAVLGRAGRGPQRHRLCPGVQRDPGGWQRMTCEPELHGSNWEDPDVWCCAPATGAPTRRPSNRSSTAFSCPAMTTLPTAPHGTEPVSGSMTTRSHPRWNLHP